MKMEKALEELADRRARALEMGGAEKVERHRSRGKLDVRTRIEKLVDPGTFREVGTLSGSAQYDADGNLVSMSPANFIFGRAKIDGRDVVIAADDFTVRGGAADASIREKSVQAEKMANHFRIPMIRLIDATGGSVRTVEAMGRTYVPGSPAWGPIVSNLETVPVVSLVLGSVAGIASARAVASHLTVMVKDTSHMFIGGPPVVARLGIETTKDSLGGYKIHEKSGAVDMVVGTEEDAFAAARQFLSYLPSSVGEQLPQLDRCEVAPDQSLRDIVPEDRRKIYKMREIVTRVVDPGSFMEMAPMFGRASIQGLARVDGRTVAIMASDPRIYGGGWNADTCDKIARFFDFVETFRIPVLNFVDCPGFVIGPDAERTGTIRHGARTMSAIYRSTVPIMAILIRKVFGVAGAAHMNHEVYRHRIAWPSGDWGSIPLEGGIEAAYAADLEAAEDREATLAEIVARLDALRSPFRTAEAFGVEEIIDPADTRENLVEFVHLAYRRNMIDKPPVRYRP
ncbi:methylmalonyl-CoA carboxyltransferase [Oceanicola sp. 22II-s10i]|uniref:acyl-CoA carboxylase subunit beta n=1 Tax=Oceanicola sp. 22II-s10i TaxID=1317116 RepID=UPI000B527865|nr:carboxyl transferase domain-containing protein [Oceanicola sp. 22II-s10i]OWU86700.1 methylmalonyl-CoA carboxyltransferase [Oceanicola sp. 22II-s10i]